MNEFLQQNQDTLIALFFFFTVLSLALAAFLGYRLHFSEKKADLRLKQARADITDMTILFQTMRDIIGQQKSLAKDFNEELEHKMEQVKHLLSQGMEKNKQLYDKQHRIVAELEEAQAQIDGIIRQIAHVRNSAILAAPPAAGVGTAPAVPAPAPEIKPAPVTVPTTPDRTLTAPSPRTAPTPARATAPPADPRDLPVPQRNHLIRAPRTADPKAAKVALSAEEEARLADTGITKAPFTSWIAEDLLGASKPEPIPAPPKPREPDPMDAGPRNGDAAREAFRALLNMPAAPHPAPDTGPLDVLPRSDFTPETDLPPDDGPNHLSVPLQQRVLEYSEAGMTVAQVSRELGIGKGEVRLMLSLARQKSPQRE